MPVESTWRHAQADAVRSRRAHTTDLDCRCRSLEVTGLGLSVEAMFVVDFNHRVCKVRGGVMMEPGWTRGGPGSR